MKPFCHQERGRKFLNSILDKLSSCQHGLEICYATIGHGQKANGKHGREKSGGSQSTQSRGKISMTSEMSGYYHMAPDENIRSHKPG